jgi:hypothetical protein
MEGFFKRVLIGDRLDVRSPLCKYKGLLGIRQRLRGERHRPGADRVGDKGLGAMNR